MNGFPMYFPTLESIAEFQAAQSDRYELSLGADDAVLSEKPSGRIVARVKDPRCFQLMWGRFTGVVTNQVESWSK